MELLDKYFSEFTPTQRQQLEALSSLYQEWNARINVISRKDMDQFYLHHVLHSLTIATQFSFTPGSKVIDLGCGGGFPGVPLAIFFPETEFLQVDSIRKKLTVVESIAEAIGLNNITVKHSRIEEIRDRKVDVVISRAVAPLGELWKWSKPVLRKKRPLAENEPNGLICLKGGDLTVEIQQSGCKPYIWEVDKIFPEPHFAQKFMLYQPI
jgi:16S rRNA (guanine527-N7)-methyltransferase